MIDADIDSYMDYLHATFPDFVNITEIGRSTENRPIRAIRLHQAGGRPNKKTILIDAGKLLLINIWNRH